MSMVVAGAAAYRLALDEARDGIKQQSADLQDVRRQTSLVFGIAVGAILLAAIDWSTDRPPGWFVYTAIIIVNIINGLWLNTCWPRTFVFTSDPAKIVEQIENPPSLSFDTATQARDLALWHGVHYDKNRKKLVSLLRGYRVAMLLLVVEVAWLLAWVS
jgi:hypothetical protein